MLLNIKLALSSLLNLINFGTSMKVYDLFMKPSGSVIRELHRNCSYPCEKISDKMVAVVTGALNLNNIHFDSTKIALISRGDLLHTKLSLTYPNGLIATKLGVMVIQIRPK